MLNNHYSFLSHWRVEAAADEVFRIMADWSKMPQWWPAVVVRADVLHAGGTDGVGSVYKMSTRGWFPYVIRSQMQVVEKHYPHRIRTRAEGELRGEVRVGSAVTVGADGVVEGPITAPVVRVGGRVVGNVVATDRVEVSPSGSLEGDIAAPRVVIAEGAFFKGKVEMRGGVVDKAAAAGRAPGGGAAARPEDHVGDEVRDKASEKPGKKAGK